MSRSSTTPASTAGVTPPEKADNQPLWGTVRAVQANYYQVRLQTSQQWPAPTLLCTRRALLKKMGQKVAVGDRVRVEEPDWVGKRGAIAAIQPRRTYLTRPPVANVDRALIVCSLAEPTPDPYQLTRFLVQAAASQLEVCVCLNKADLVDEQTREEWRSRLQSWGYEPLLVSAYTGEGVAQLERACADKIAVVAGASGVGKSSLLNQLMPGLQLRTQPVSGRLRHGRHTTRHVELFELPNGGWIADSPGFNSIELDACVSQSLVQWFPEAREAAHQCQFDDCTHLTEPGCGVRALNWERYEYFCRIAAEIAEREAVERDRTHQRHSVKYKNKRGAQVAEPLLDSRYRQQSRKSRRQTLHRMQGDVESILRSELADE